jgi:hypothetical protein
MKRAARIKPKLKMRKGDKEGESDPTAKPGNIALKDRYGIERKEKICAAPRCLFSHLKPQTVSSIRVAIRSCLDGVVAACRL